MNETNAKYFDGQSSVSLPAHVRADERGLKIELNPHLPGPREIEIEWTALRLCDRVRRGLGVVKAGSFPFQTLEVYDPTVLDTIEVHFNKKRPQSGFEKVVRARGLVGIFTGLGILAGMVALWFLVFLPLIVSSVLTILPESADQRMGNAMAASLAETWEIDSAGSRQAQAYFDALKYPTPYPFKIYVVHGDVVNAFAIPGGHIVVYDALLHKMKSHEELAGLLAHEAVHVTERHTMEGMVRSLAQYFIISAVTSDIAGISGVLAENADMLYSLNYSRSRETEADTIGARFMHQSGMSHLGMVSLFETLKHEHEGISMPEFLATHPNLDTRVKYLKTLQDLPSGQQTDTQQLEELFRSLKAGAGSHSY